MVRCRAVLIACVLMLGFLPYASADVGLDLTVAKQAKGRGESDARMAFLHLQLFNRLHPNFDLMNEMTVGRLENPVHGYIIGINEVGRVSFSGARKSSFFADIGFGVNYFGPHKGVPEVTGPMQFSIVMGAGYRFNPKNKPVAYTFSYRVTHFSNAETMKPNVGLNLHTVSIGVIFH